MTVVSLVISLTGYARPVTCAYVARQPALSLGFERQLPLSLRPKPATGHEADAAAAGGAVPAYRPCPRSLNDKKLMPYLDSSRYLTAKAFARLVGRGQPADSDYEPVAVQPLAFLL